MVKQGDIIKLADTNCLALVISKDSYNETGHVIACPVIKNKPDATLSLEIKDGSYALCDNLRRLDLNTRSYHVTYNISMSKTIYVVDMVQSIFDYFQKCDSVPGTLSHQSPKLAFKLANSLEPQKPFKTSVLE